MSFCYGIAWLFHFEMSSNTTTYVGPAGSSYRDYLLLVPYSDYSRVLSYCSVKQAQMKAGPQEGYIFRNLLLSLKNIKSRVQLRSRGLRSGVMCRHTWAVSFANYILDTWGNILF